MATAYEEQSARTYFLIDTDSGDRYTFHYGFNPEDRMCGLRRHNDDQEPELLGSAVPLFKIEVGKRALLGVDTCFREFHLLETSTVKSIGPAPPDLIP